MMENSPKNISSSFEKSCPTAKSVTDLNLNKAINATFISAPENKLAIGIGVLL